MIAFAIMMLVSFFGVVSAGAPLQTSHGIICLVTGAAMLLFPPRIRLPWPWWLMAALFFLLCSLAFLPKGLFFVPAWRQAVEALGVDTGSFVTAHPRQTWEYLAGVGITVLVALFLLGHRVSERAQQVLAVCFAGGIGLYAASCMWLHARSWRLAWDPEETFGLLPNRNHTATLLVMGVVVSLGILLRSARRKQGGMAGIAAAAVAVSAWAVLGYCGSRAGVLLLVLGLGGWMAGLGRAAISWKVLTAVFVFVAAGAGVFWFSETPVKGRLTNTVEQVIKEDPGVKAKAPFAGRAGTREESRPVDLRFLIYKDTVSMIIGEPLTGVGLGMFRYSFPQHRALTPWSGFSMHPESDWLMMAAEAGCPATLVLAGLITAVLAVAVHQARRRRGWSLRWALLVAAMSVPVHGICDVPGHRVGLAWSALLLAALSFRIPDAVHPPSLLAGVFSRLGGAAVLLAGVSLVRAEWWGGPQSAIVQPHQLADRARALFAEDAARLSKLSPDEVAALPEHASYGTLKPALALVEEALAITPLEPDLHYLKGALALQFDEMDATAHQAFAVERLLDPFRVEVPLWQAHAWASIDPGRTASLWTEALRRAEVIEARWQNPEVTREQVWVQIMTQAGGRDEMSRLALTLASTDKRLLLVWAQHASPAVIDEAMLSLLTAHSPIETRRELFRVWLARGDKAKASEFAKGKAEFEDLK